MQHFLNSILHLNNEVDIYYIRNKKLIDKLEREYWENEKLKDKWILENELRKNTQKIK